MPLAILGPMVVIGIAGIAIALHLLGLSRIATLESEAAARAAWAREMGDDPARAVTLAHEGHAALIETESGRHGIVFAMGGDFTVRYLDGARLRPVPGGLAIDLPDFTAPHIRVALDTGEAARWPALIAESA